MPLLKLLGIVVKSLSKPISGYVKDHLKDSPMFGKIMTTIGRKYQKASNYINNTKTTFELDETRAISLGSEIVVEFMFFSIAGFVVLYDNKVSKEKSNILNSKIDDLTKTTNQLKLALCELNRRVIELQDNKKL